MPQTLVFAHSSPSPFCSLNNELVLLPFSLQAREGLGGGFNERQDRASVATVEVDEDGYDDFGRKKNKARADKKAKEVSFGLTWLGSARPGLT